MESFLELIGINNMKPIWFIRVSSHFKPSAVDTVGLTVECMKLDGTGSRKVTIELPVLSKSITNTRIVGAVAKELQCKTGEIAYLS